MENMYMSKLDKAKDFYLRGFNGQYIKRRTNISIQSLLKQLNARGEYYTRFDIIDYQVKYIQQHYTNDDVINAYKNMSKKYKDPYKMSKGRHIVMLGCGFGDYAKVFSQILGADIYKQLRNDCWKIKQTATVRQKYGVDNVFCKEAFSIVATKDAVERGRKKRVETLVSRYGVESPNANVEICARMQESLKATNMKRYGVQCAMQVPDIARKSALNRQQSMLNTYGAKNSVEIPEIREKIFKKRKENGTLNTSNPERVLGNLLREKFGVDDVLHNVIVDNRYPYHVDYYIKSLDLFIELNGDKCHNTHWFDMTNERDLQIVQSWTENMIRLECETGKVSRYRKYIKTWTQTDVEKRNAAKVNNLNYLVFWDGSNHVVNHKQIPNLSDVYDWLNAGCPMPKNWLPQNTY